MECGTISNNISSSNVTFDAHSLLVEELQQQLHHANKQLESGNLLKNEMEYEIERLQKLVEYNETHGKIEKNDILKHFNEKINSLQCELEEEREKGKKELDALKEKINSTKHPVVKEEVPTDHELLKEQVESLKEEIMEIREQLSECMIKKQDIETVNAQLIDKTKDLEEKLEATKDMLKVKADSLQSTVEALEELKEEKVLLSSELTILKAGPLENKDRGNSLFSEVDIKRQEVERKMDILRNKYLQAKKVLALKNNQMETLKAENRKITMFWDEEVSNVRQREQKLLESYKQTNEELRSLIKKLELRLESQTIITISDKDISNMQWIQTVIDEARTEARELRKAYENKSCEMLLTQENFYLMSIEIKNLKMQSIKDQALIEELKSKLAAFENPNNTINPEEQGTVLEKKNSCSGPEKKMITQSNGVLSSKTVRFAQD